MSQETMLYARALLLRNCGRFTHVSSDFGSQYRTHTFASSEALYASLTRGVTWRHDSRFVDLKEDAKKSASSDYFFCDYDIKGKPIWFTPGIFVDKELQPLTKQRDVVNSSDFNVVNEGYPSTGGNKRPYFVPTYGRIEGVLPDHSMLTCALAVHKDQLEGFTSGQTFLMGKKRTMFQLVEASSTEELIEVEGDASIEECQPVQVKIEEVNNFREYEILVGTARYLLVRGRAAESSLSVSFASCNDIPAFRRILPEFWVEQIRQMLHE